jgi:hypothetical protein
MFREREAARDAMVETGAVLQAEEAFRSPFAGQELPVPLVDIGGDELGALRVRSRDKDGRDSTDVGREPCSVEVPDCCLGRDQDLAAQVTALLL